ncbi:hypothetical protein [Clostridium butyricum]|uniref:hypothetical protein n=1 Tax=Clostridium butyricum TaxID=1492 RepID=UPI0003A308AF|nr:hypothetical protein [Clostridium butyricum]MBZ5745615.1 hypothetical protein [Clostridium butyricum]MDI9209555.1 hypothetical protein [Clostridium butyricum]BBK77346.1 hypothetical protein Cbu04g_23540 [Clostridium butyricum]GEQ24344.1 hypothetical protein CBU03nite_07670 [Clostridium butyricum]
MEEELRILAELLKETATKYNLSYVSNTFMNGCVMLNAQNQKEEKCANIFITEEE